MLRGTGERRNSLRLCRHAPSDVVPHWEAPQKKVTPVEAPVPMIDAVRELMCGRLRISLPERVAPALDLSPYDQLIPNGAPHE